MTERFGLYYKRIRTEDVEMLCEGYTAGRISRDQKTRNDSIKELEVIR
jgi:hypothetical protein